MVNLLWATLFLILLTLLPAGELRLSIIVGILGKSVHLPLLGSFQGFGLPWWYVFLVCVSANILLGPVWYWLLDTIVHGVRQRWPWFDRQYHRHLERTQRRIHAQVERWGWLGLALFIAIPLPASGVYSGGLVAYALGMGQRKFLYATIIGVLIAGTAVTLFALGLGTALAIF